MKIATRSNKKLKIVTMQKKMKNCDTTEKNAEKNWKLWQCRLNPEPGEADDQAASSAPPQVRFLMFKSHLQWFIYNACKQECTTTSEISNLQISFTMVHLQCLQARFIYNAYKQDLREDYRKSFHLFFSRYNTWTPRQQTVPRQANWNFLRYVTNIFSKVCNKNIL